MTRVARAAPILALVLLSVPGGVAPARAADGGTRRALAELKSLCDRGLVDPGVCREKQRAILGLPATVPQGPEPAPTPAPAAEVPAAPDQTSSAPRRHASRLGFEVTLPPGWLPIEPDAVRSGFATLRQQIDNGGATGALLDRIERHALDGTTDLFTRGRDHVQVQRAPAAPPADPGALARFCARLEANASRTAGRPLSTRACGTRLVAGAPALYVERDALLPGMRTVQYWVPAPRGRAVVFVLSCAQDRPEPCRRDFDAMVGSLAWPQR